MVIRLAIIWGVTEMDIKINLALQMMYEASTPPVKR
jgi:hypothetical protein